jgi:hypothetical protein
MIDVAGALAWTLGSLVVGATPVLLYRRATARARATWTFVEPVRAATGGAYRDATILVTRTPGMPSAVRVASLWSLFLLVPALISIPLVGVGFVEGAAPAFLFGPLGLLLAFFVVRAGYTLPRASRAVAEHARGVAYAEIAHNVVVVASVGIATLFSSESWEIWRADQLGGFALAYAVLSFAHAGWLLHAVDEHLRHGERLRPATAAGAV